MTVQKRVLVLSGRGRYEDPWHDMAATSHRVAAVLAEPGPLRGSPARGDSRPTDVLDGVDVVVRGAFPDAAEDLADFDLLVVNTASGRLDAAHDGDDARWVPFHEAVRGWADAGRPVLALHQSANTFADSPHWERILGGRWVDGHSMHPPIGLATFTVAEPDHPIGAPLVSRLTGAVTAFDERYSYLRVAPDVDVIVTHVHDGVAHPVVWVNEAGGLRVVYDGLGHDVRSYDSASRRALLRSEAAWLLARSQAAAAASSTSATGEAATAGEPGPS